MTQAFSRPVGGVICACGALLLGLPPSSSPALAAGQPLAHLLACRALAEPAARLECFDRESALIDTESAITIPAQPAPALDPQRQFGLPERTVITGEVAAGRRPVDAIKIEARLSSVSVGANGHMVFGLDNDQVWRQLANGDDVLARPGDAVTISRAALGSYWLKTASGRGCKVSRVR